MIGFAPAGLDVTTASVSADPGLLSADPGMMATAAHAFASAAQKLQATSQVSAKASAQLSTYWLGRGVQGFDTASTKANAGARVAGGALAGAAGALMTLSAQITAAQALARRALALAEQSAQAASALQSAYAASSEQAVAALPAGATADQAMAARAPTPGQVAQADAISADAALATQLMAEANTTARQAWAQAAAAFDAVTAQAPSVQAAVASARAEAASASRGGGSLLGGIVNILGAAALPIGSAAADFFSDGAAAGATPEEAAAEDSLVSDGIADLAGGGASAADITAAEETAAENAVVDGGRVGAQVAEDAAGGPEPQAVYENSVAEPLTSEELQALDDYTGNAYYRSLNAALREGTPLTPEQQALSDNLSSALAKMPDYEGIVYRGMNLTSEQLAEYVPGETVTWDAFTSTDTTDPFPGNTQVVIESSTGKLISAYSQVETENEVLFDKGSQFVVESNQQVDGTTYLTLRQAP